MPPGSVEHFQDTAQAGFIPTFRLSLHRHQISAMAVSPSWNLLACGDRGGLLTIVNFQGTQLYYSRPFHERTHLVDALRGDKGERHIGISSLCFTFSYAGADLLSPLLVVGTDDGVIHLLSIRRDEAVLSFSILSSIKPKVPSRPVYLAVLDDVGQEIDAQAAFDSHAPGLHYLVIVHEKQIRVHLNLAAKGKYAKVAFEDGRTILRGTLIDKGVDQTCLAVLLSDGDLNLYSLPDLDIIKNCSARAEEAAAPGGFASTPTVAPAHFREMVLNKHGKAVTHLGNFEVQRLSVWCELPKLDWSKYLGVPFREGVSFPDPPTAGLSNLFGLLKADTPAELNTLCKPKHDAFFFFLSLVPTQTHSPLTSRGAGAKAPSLGG